MRLELGCLPDPVLNPNAKWIAIGTDAFGKKKYRRIYWRDRADAKAVARETTGWLVVEQGRPAKPYKKAHISILWIAKHRRVRDIDNLMSAMKGYIDGLMDGGLIEDDSYMHVRYSLEYQHGSEDNTIIEVTEE